jgi:hypothetical protein
MNYVFENGMAIGYMDGDRFINFLIPIKAWMLEG